MLMKVQPDLEPLARVRAAVSGSCQKTLDLLIGAVLPPTDQPYAAQAISTLCRSLLAYADGLYNVRPEFAAVLDDARAIATIVEEQCTEIQGHPPAGMLSRRVSKFPGWALLTQVPQEAIPLFVALGAEVALAILEGGQIKAAYCAALRRDIFKYGRPQEGDARLESDLQELQFGRRWLASFNKIDRQVRRKVELPDPEGPPRPEHANPRHCLDILASLRWRYEYPNPKHRQSALDDSQVTLAQFGQAAQEVRVGVEAHEPGAVVKALSIITGLTPELALSLPLIEIGKPLNTLGIDVKRGTLVLDLRSIFPGRKQPPAGTVHLYEESGHRLEVPLPLFLALDLSRRCIQTPHTLLLGDLVKWTQVNSRESLVIEDISKLKLSLARVARTTGAVATGLTDRAVAACLTLDFSLTGSARMYYCRLTGRDIHAGASKLYSSMGWDEPALDEFQLLPCGSLSELRADAVSQVFGHMAQACTASWPGRHTTMARLMNHHELYARYCVALLSFCMGLRSAKAYRLYARDLAAGQSLVTIHDKMSGDAMMAQPVVLNDLVLAQILQYLAHTRALVDRLNRIDSNDGNRFAKALDEATRANGYLFQIQTARGNIRPLGVHMTWGVLPPELRITGNSGRHFWQNTLRREGLGSRDVDRFMRHRVVGLESNTTSQLASPQRSFERINQAQLRVLKKLGIQALSGLRRA